MHRLDAITQAVEIWAVEIWRTHGNFVFFWPCVQLRAALGHKDVSGGF